MKQRSFLSIICLVLLSFCVSSVSPQPCTNNRRNFIPNSTYDSNRRLILSSLPSNASSRDGFYYSSFGHEPDRIYALGMCIPGSSPSDCSDCIEGALALLIKECVNQTDAYYWNFDPTLRLVRYSNVSFSGSAASLEIGPQYLVLTTATIDTDLLTEFKRIWEELTLRMIAAASTASSTPSIRNNYYKVDVANLTKLENIYALMQCTPDITPADCENCLRQGVREYQSCCGNNTGGYVMRPICFFRWQLFTFSKAFENIRLPPPLSPSPPTPSPPLQRHPATASPPTAGDQGKIKYNSSGNISMRTIVAIVVVVVVIVFIILGLLACWFARKRKSYQEVELNQTGITSVRSLQYNFKTIEEATNNFSESNKLGQGGFGDVFKGTLPDGKEIAVKRLSRTSEQSKKEFKNEVVLVAKLQHRNLVRLLGFSVKREEKIIVYEFLPNRSLDYILFDPSKQGELDWKKRYKIIEGVARGILYLHQDSQPTIIHRDLKAGNILLDAHMNPKVADFGTARIFGMGQSVANTENPAGTRGYMAPEYRDQGQFSMKSDVFSFGVLVLEIICGKKNTSFSFPVENFVTYAWRLWSSGSPLDLVDPTIAENYQSEEVTRCIHIALLCVQEEPSDRPEFSQIITWMLTSNSLILPVPKPPTSVIPDRPNQSTVRPDSQTITDELEPC